MFNRIFTRYAAFLIATLFLSVAPALAQPIILPATSGQPNIIFILTDDLDSTSIAYMPHLKSFMIDQGMSFENYLVDVSLCCPSRATTLRGQYAHNHQILTNKPPFGGFGKFFELGHEASTIATWLQDAGYRTMLYGKYLNGYPPKDNPTYVPPGWNRWFGSAGNGAKGFDYTLNQNGTLVEYGSNPDDYFTDVMARKVVKFIQRSVDKPKPFFMYLAPHAPHGPSTPATRHADLFSDLQAPRTASFNEEDVSDKPPHMQSRELLTDEDIAAIDEEYRQRLRSLQAVDEMIAQIIAELEATGQLENTYLVFTSDNGFHLGEHRIPRGKRTPYEESINLPLVIRGPGIPQGSVNSYLVGNIDLAPTFAEWGGATIPDFVDGRSLVPLLSMTPLAESEWRNAFLIQHKTTNGSGKKLPDFFGLRTRQYTYLEYVTSDREFYDLVSDPYQLQNSVETADPILLQALAQRVAELKDCAGESCRTAEMR